MKEAKGIVHTLAKLAVLGPVRHGREERVYGDMLKEEGFSRIPGGWLKGDQDAPVILTAHLDTVKYKHPTHVRVKNWAMKGVGGGIGADDKVGVTLITHLAREEMKGVAFALFEGEEVGAVGSTQAERAGMFEKARAVVSLDRAGTTDIVYVQGGWPTGSEEFASLVGERLGMENMTPNTRGVFTDSEVFAHRVPECLNLSVGYYQAHTNEDWIDLRHMVRLYTALRNVDWVSLSEQVVRVPSERTPRWEDWPLSIGRGIAYDPYYDEYEDYYYGSKRDLARELANYPWSLYGLYEDAKAVEMLVKLVHNSVENARKLLAEMSEAEREVLRDWYR